MKKYRKILVSSMIMIITSCLLFVGTTFAWFSDSVSSSNNIIKAGNLDVELEYWDGTKWEDVNGASDILGNSLWEPGVTEVAYLRLANAGTLALKYNLGINIVSEIEGTNVAGEKFKLSDYIMFGVVENVNGETNPFAGRDIAISEVVKADKISVGYSKPSYMEAGAELYLALVVYMPTSVGNEANHNGINIPEINLGINVFASQYAYESDSFGSDYDLNSVAFSVDDAMDMIMANKDVTFANCIEPNKGIYVPEDYEGTITLCNVSLATIQRGATTGIASLSAEVDVLDLVVLGDVVVKATEEGMSAISASHINITGDGTLTAIGKGTGAFGIGGLATESINIEGVTIEHVEGGHAYGVGNDTKYYKDAPEGGAAIGSGKDGAMITLNNVTINKAIGGSKAAAIGARYHVGVIVNINDSIINYAEGGVSAAGIGSSRVSSEANESGTVINIDNSAITAVGGAYGAGIGSGYDTHCLSKQPMCTIKINDSVINATGGAYGAGVGTGYHNAALSGEITNSEVNATQGEAFYKDSYTMAMGVGFGVVDPTREGQQTDSKINYNGTVISLSDAPFGAKVQNNDELDSAIKNGKGTIILAAGTYNVPVSAKGKTLHFIGLGKDTVVELQYNGSYEGCDYNLQGSSVVFENLTLVPYSVSYSGYAGLNATYINCTISGSYTLYGDSNFINCEFNISGDNYNIWTWAAPTATFQGCTFNTSGKAILLYGGANTVLTATNCVFNDANDYEDVNNKAAIEVGSDWSTDHKTIIATDCTVNGFDITSKGINTGTTLWGNKNSLSTDRLSVTINGVKVY